MIAQDFHQSPPIDGLQAVRDAVAIFDAQKWRIVLIAGRGRVHGQGEIVRQAQTGLTQSAQLMGMSNTLKCGQVNSLKIKV